MILYCHSLKVGNSNDADSRDDGFDSLSEKEDKEDHEDVKMDADLFCAPSCC